VPEETKETGQEAKTEEKSELGNKLSAVGWALFLIWVGIAVLVNLGLGFGLLGVGVITLGVQAVRRYCGLELVGFWAVVGLLFLLGGALQVLKVSLPLVPILLVGAGIVLLVQVLRGKRPTEKPK
jgi:hypothetical protein